MQNKESSLAIHTGHIQTAYSFHSPSANNCKIQDDTDMLLTDMYNDLLLISGWLFYCYRGLPYKFETDMYTAN